MMNIKDSAMVDGAHTHESLISGIVKWSTMTNLEKSCRSACVLQLTYRKRQGREEPHPLLR